MSERMWRRGPDGEIIRAEPAAPPPPATEDPDNPPVPARPRAKLGIALKLGFRDTYDYLGSLVLAGSIASFLTAAAVVGANGLVLKATLRLPGFFPLLLSLLAGAVALILVGGPFSGGLFRFAHKAAAREEPELFDFAWGFRAGFGTSLKLASVQVFGSLALAGNCAFYLAQHNLPLMALGASFGYLLVFWCAAMLYQWPLLFEGAGVKTAIRKSALLVLDNVPFTLGILAVALIVVALCGVSVIGIVLLLPGALAMLTTQATRELLRKYGLLPPDPTLDPIADETHDTSGLGWHE
jgi:hypothetical protein